jgi:pilus assembly protein Flp/PilA
MMSDRRGATAVEYGIIMSLMFLALVGAATRFGEKNEAVFNKVEDAIAKA